MYSMIGGAFLDWLKERYNKAYGPSMSESVNEAFYPEKFTFLGQEINLASVFSAILVTLVILIACILLRIFLVPRLKEKPKGIQLLLEGLVGFFDNSAKSVAGKQTGFLGMYIFTTALFIACSTLAELFGLRPALSSINCCIALGLCSFSMIHICGFREKGLKRLKHYANPINIITDLAVPLSLSLRLFGSITSGFIIMELVYTFIYTSFVLPIAVSFVTTFFHALIQSYLFATLTVLFVGEALE